MLIEMLKEMKKVFSTENSELKYSSAHELVLAFGREYRPNENSLNYGKMANRECFRNAAMMASDYEELTYVEGFAFTKGFEGLPLLHAWCIDENENVVEVTWKEAGSEYFGIAFETDYLWDTLSVTKMYGLITEFPNKKYNPYKNGFPISGLKKRKVSV